MLAGGSARTSRRQPRSADSSIYIRGSACRGKVQTCRQRLTLTPDGFSPASLDVEAETQVPGCQRRAIERRGDVLICARAVAVRHEDLEEVPANRLLDPEGPSEVGFERVGEIAVGRDDFANDAESGRDHQHRAGRNIE